MIFVRYRAEEAEVCVSGVVFYGGRAWTRDACRLIAN